MEDAYCLDFVIWQNTRVQKFLELKDILTKREERKL